MTEFTDAVAFANEALNRPSFDADNGIQNLSRQFIRALESLAKSIEFGCAAKEALRGTLEIIDEIDEYQKRPERGAWGVECACCMGEMFNLTERKVIDTARLLVEEKPDLSAEREIISNVIVPPASDGRIDRGNR